MVCHCVLMVPLTHSCERALAQVPQARAHSTNHAHAVGCLMSATCTKVLWWCFLSIALVIAFFMFSLRSLSEGVKVCQGCPRCDLVLNV